MKFQTLGKFENLKIYFPQKYEEQSVKTNQ